jgi:protein-disulfide isomerase
MRRPIFAAAIGFALGLALASPAFSQFAAPVQGTKVLDASALHPPTGTRVAIVEFADLECPACAMANPVVKQAVEKYKIPWVRHDLLIPGHIWSRNAAVSAHWFDSKSPILGGQYRDEVFASQRSIYSLATLNLFTQRFAQSHGVALPPSLDPAGKLSDAVQADSELSRRTGIVHTPTIFVVAANSKGASFIEVQNVEHDLYQAINQALADTKTYVKSDIPARHAPRR